VKGDRETKTVDGFLPGTIHGGAFRHGCTATFSRLAYSSTASDSFMLPLLQITALNGLSAAWMLERLAWLGSRSQPRPRCIIFSPASGIIAARLQVRLWAGYPIPDEATVDACVYEAQPSRICTLGGKRDGPFQWLYISRQGEELKNRNEVLEGLYVESPADRG
jgi:hypothetical protein